MSPYDDHGMGWLQGFYNNVTGGGDRRRGASLQSKMQDLGKKGEIKTGGGKERKTTKRKSKGDNDDVDEVR